MGPKAFMRHKTSRTFNRCISFLFVLGFISGTYSCSTPPKATPRLLQEQILNLPKDRSQPFERTLLSGMEINDDTKVSQALRKLVESLKRKESQSEVSASDDTLPNYRIYRSKIKKIIPSFIIPPSRGYIEHAFALSLAYENELAAAIALSWELALDTNFQERFLEQVEEKNPNPGQVYNWDDIAIAGAVERAIDRLYHARYDPRGLISMLAKIKDWSPERVQYLQDKARRTIAFYTPLMSPIVRSDSFYRLRRQLEKW